jgi:hypothetical protein
LANIFWTGEKSPEKETLEALRKKAVKIWDGAFHTMFKGGILELVVEVDDVSESTGLWDQFDEAKFMGHEFHILKVPIGYVEFLKSRNK